jgi:acyl transferase domain-containing protein/short-subunit dehydrogenase/acyl carrier protein
MGALPKGGAMAAIEATEQEVAESIQGKEAELSIAALNGPTSTVISGKEQAVEEIRSQWEDKDRRTKRLAVSHAFHSPLIEPMLDEFAAVCASLSFNEPQVPIVSNLSGETLSAEQATDPAYWVRHAREAVRFADTVATLASQGATTFVELGPDPVLLAMAQEALGADADAEAGFVPTLRDGREEKGAIVATVAQAHATGAKPEWDAFFAGTGAKRVPLPTYPFQRKRYWLDSASVGDPVAAGQAAADHPLLGAAVELAGDGEGLLLTGRIGLATHPWLADHVVGEVALLPGTALLELALRAAEGVDAATVEELTLQAPVALPESGAVSIQVSVAAEGEDGRREIAIHSRVEGEAWALNASGALSEREPDPLEPLDTWPPAAEPLDATYLYDRLGEHGLRYGPVFQGLGAAWRDGESIYAEVALPEERGGEAGRFALHPALLDAALHAIALGATDDAAAASLPFSWNGVSLRAVGARQLRVRLTPGEEGGVALAIADGAGAPLGTVESLLTRPLDPAQLGATARRDGLLAVEWAEVGLGDTGPGSEEVESLRCDAEDDGELAESAQRATTEALKALQEWLADESKASSRLVLITRGAVATGGEEAPDPVAAAIWGLVRSAQSEHPGRFGLIDTDGSEASEAALAAATALGAEEPQLALREGVARAPRLARLAEEAPEGAGISIDPERTVLIAGGTGSLGGLVAKHLVECHGARHLLLVSRSGPAAADAEGLREQLEAVGATVEIVACDLADRGALAGLLGSIPAERPLGAVFHAAGALADATLESLDDEEVAHAFAPKVDAAANLDELTADADLSAFVLFSSAVATLGGPGQANYAAANAFLDALAQHRRADGRAATAIAWGLWARESGMAAGLGEADLARLRRGGIEPLGDERGLALLDVALAADRPLALAAPLAAESLRGMAAAGALPPIFAGLVRAPRRRAAAAGSLATRLAGLAEAEAESLVLELVRGEVAAVLGHAGATEIVPERAFQELGFDSLAAVELRNRLGAISGLRLPATIVFDYPSAAALAAHLRSLAGAGAERRVAVRAGASEEPIAIVGMACRYPGGVASPDDLWRLVAEGRDGISKFPADRGWDLARVYDPDPEHPGTSYTREGGFLDAAGEFDAEFFGIAPREAMATDPQQRLLLESCWEALEDAGIDPTSLRGADTGVFAGAMYQDYGPGAGGSSSIVSGRIAYTLGLEGPAMTVDTACSSSLVTLHLAGQALRGGECALALAGGVTVLSTPGVFVEFSRQRGLAPDGRSKSFADGADGVAWSEGVGVLVLERLSDARRNGHRVLATLRGSAVNQDGASNGLTAPNGPSQERVIMQALANAGLSPEDVDAVEGHGTGTTLGDPIEAGALLATYGRERERPLKLGSIKSNIGHTQAAAGVAGVIKMTMAMRAGVLPKTLHLDAPSSKVDWEAGEIELLAENAAWEAGRRPRRAGISSFGISGTNAHVILEEAPASLPVGDPEAGEAAGASSKQVPGPVPLVLSAKSGPALAAAAARLAAHLEEHRDLDLTEVARSLVAGRASLMQRAVALGEDRGTLLAALRAVADGEPSPDVLEGRAGEGKLAYLFTGQGSQRLGMGAGLYETDPLFEAAFDEVCEELDKHLDTPLREVVFATEAKLEARLDDTTYAQPALFAIEVALSRALAKRGLKPDLLAGHSVGEIAAAHVAHVLDLPDAAKLICARGALMGALPKGGAMAAIEATEAELVESLAGREEELSLAAVNGPGSTVVSGVEEAVEEICSKWEEQGRRTKRLAVSHAFHSPLMEPMLDEFAAVCASLSFNEPQVPIVSNLTGEALGAEQATDPAYWVRHAREAVRFADTVAALQAQGATTFVELGPDPVLCAMARECLGEEAGRFAFVSTLREGRAERGAATRALAAAHAAGAAVEWSAFFAGSGAGTVPLPTYPFQRKRYWLASALSGAADASAIGQGDPEHPLLAAAIEDPGSDTLLLSGRISLAAHPWLLGHAVGGIVLLPGTALLELALTAAEQVGATTVEELTLEAPLALDETVAVAIRASVSAAGEDGRREIAIHSRSDEEGAGWVRNASGALSERTAPAAAPPSVWPPEGAEPLDVEYAYDLFAEHGLEYGPVFQGLERAWRDGERVYAAVVLPEEGDEEADRFRIHPALLDAALHGIGLAGGDGPAELRLPFSWRGASLLTRGARELRVEIAPAGKGEVSIAIADGAGAPLATVEALALRPVDPAQLKAPRRGVRGLLAVGWSETELPEPVAGTDDVELLRCPSAGEDAGAALCAAQSALAAIQAFLAEDSKAHSRLAFLTAGAIGVSGDESPDPVAAAVWGLVRSATSEHPGRFALIDSDGSEASEAALSAALALSAAEPQLALREGVALAPRALPIADAEDSLVPSPSPWRLDALRRGTLESLALVPSERAAAPLGPTEVRIEVRAAGLNFRDVLVALGLYPSADAVLGGEGAGVVVEVGGEVEGLAPGDRVLGMFPEAFGPLAVAERDVLVPVPADWSFEQAASVPIVFATALYGLRDLAGLKRGERVLVHAGAGGVGSAAIQLARDLGAEVFATASEAKWDVLREAGLDDDHIASSRDLGFREKFLAATDGNGVDVVLNALAGEFVDASLDLLPRGGRFLEMGKTDIRDAVEVAAAHGGVAYMPFDVTEAGPVRTGELLTEVTGLFERGALRHAPLATWDVRQAPRAFRHLREGRNVGKVVLTLPRAIKPERTVLVTGGTGGLGALVARHLAERHGARHLLLVSRSGAAAEGAAGLEAELRELGVNVRIAACDASDRTALAGLLATIPSEHPLGAVVHCAGVLADGTVESLGDAQLERVFAPKVEAAWNLHELTADAELSAFVLFSSAAGTLGGPGQANYAAANVFLDALAQRRSAAGLPSTSIAWGIWEREGGMGGTLGEADLARMRRGGVEAISDEQGLELFDAALAAGRPQALALPVDAAALGAMAASGALPPILSGLVRAARRPAPARGSLVAKLAALPEAEREAFVLDLVRGEVAAVLGHATAAEVEPGLAFQEMGFDSLAAVELRNRLGSATGLGLGATTVFDYPSPAALAGHLLELSAGVGGARAGLAGGFEQLEAMLDEIPPGHPSRAELAAQLRDLAAGLERGGRVEIGPDDVKRLESASDDELLAFIDEQVGSHE